MTNVVCFLILANCTKQVIKKNIEKEQQEV